MSNPIRWNPWQRVARWDPWTHEVRDVESMLRDVPGVPDMRVDIGDNGKAYTLKAELPGVEKDDIHVSVDGTRVSITAEVRRDPQDKDVQRVCSERFYGQVHRSFALDGEVDAAGATAQLDKGVLQLTLPKKAGGQARRLAIQ